MKVNLINISNPAVFEIGKLGQEPNQVFALQQYQHQFGRGILKIVGPKKQAFCPKINMLKGNFDPNYFEPLMTLISWGIKS